MRKAGVISNVLLWTAGMLGAVVGVSEIVSIEDTDTTAAAIKKAGVGAINITVYALAMNYFLKK